MNEYKGVKPGDLITAYNKGFHRLIKIKERFDKDGPINPIFVYKPVLSPRYETSKRSWSEEECDAAYCKKIDEKYLIDKRLECEREIEILREHMSPNT